MCGTNQNEACGWPSGTIRAAISSVCIFATIAVAGAMSFYFAYIKEYGWSMSALGIMGTIIGSMLGYYFGTKSSENATRVINDAHNTLLQNTIQNNDRALRLMSTLHNQPLEEV